MAANADELEMTFRLRGTPEAMAALEQFRRAMAQTGQRRDTGPMSRELDHLRREVRGITREIGSIVRPALAGFGFSASGLVLGLTAASLGLNQFSSSVLEIKRGADRIGVTVQQYRGFIDAAQKVNIAKPEAIAMMENMNKVIYEARTRTHGAWEEIVRLGGADVVGAVLNAKTPVEQMAVIWERLEFLKRQDPAKARQWAELWFNNIKATRIEWSEAMTEMAAASGLTEEQIKAAKAYHDQWIAAGQAWDRVKLTVGTAAMEGLTPLVEALTQAMENKEAVASLAQGLGGLADGLARMSPDDIRALSDGIGAFIREVGQGVSELAKGLSELMDMLELVQSRREKGQPLLGSYDMRTGKWGEDGAKTEPGVDPQVGRKPFTDPADTWRNMWRSLTRQTKDTGEKLEGVNTEFQKLVDNLRQAQTSSGGGGGGGLGSDMAGLFGGGGGRGGGGAMPSYSASRMSGGAADQERLGTAPGGTAPGGGRVNYFQRQGQAPFSRGELSTVQTPYGSVAAHPQAADDVKNFWSEMKEAGFPASKLGSYANRQKRWGGGPSSHAYGAAWDIDDTLGINAAQKKWLQENPDKFREMLKRNNMSQPLPQKDPNHIEWTGPSGRPKVDGAQLDKAIGSAGSVKARPNSFDISIDATAAGEKKPGSAPIPSSIMENNPKQMAINPQSGVGAQP